jgi:hypothetical protein
LGGVSLPPVMRKGMLIVGIVLLVIGAILAGYAFSATSQTLTIVPGSAVQPSTNTIGSDPVTISWSGGTSTTTVTLWSASAGCSNPMAVASGTGASGSFSATLTAGGTYCITAGTSTVSVTVDTHGITFLEMIGLVLLIIGVILAAVGAIRKPRVRPVGTGAQTAAEVSAAATEAGSDVYTAGPEAPSTPPAGARPNQVCSHCGTTNEAWLTNCRSCKRPLSSTGQ